jgi:alkanesulfonate monooxygenase SsuD/methylene tetrahydromethanopterin reductase-like flavin-dependent oxidoreductase (luciferase family)
MFYYTPIMLAKRLATLDVLSQGRVICGLGWSKDEYLGLKGLNFQSK